MESKSSNLQDLKNQISDPAMWDNNTESTSIMKKISLLEKDISLRKRLVEKAEDLEVLYEFFNEKQVKEEEVVKELRYFF